MKKRWIVLGLFTGSAAFTLTLFWPARPLWQTTLGSLTSPLSFTADGRTLLAATGARGSSTRFDIDDLAGPPTLYRFDATTGRPLAEPQTVGHPSTVGAVILPSPDGQRLLVEVIVANNHSYCDFFDVTTGTIRPLPQLEEVLGASRLLDSQFAPIDADRFSPDGRWFWLFSNSEAGTVIELYDGTTGERVLPLKRNTPDERIACAFAPDSSLVAIMRSQQGSTVMIVELCELPSGHVRRRLKLHLNHECLSVRAWQGDRLFVIGLLPNQGLQTVSYNLTDETGIGRNEFSTLPEMIDDSTSRSWQLGPSWRVRHEVTLPDNLVPLTNPPTWRANPRRWLVMHTGWTWLAPAGWTTRLKFTVNGRERKSEPPPLPGIPIISRDGRLVATGGERLQVWDADPGPRWPWALLAGFGAMLPPLLCGRWRGLKR